MTADRPALGGRMGAGAANAPEPGGSATASGNDGSGGLRADLYRTLSPEAQELSTLIDEALPAWQRQTEPAGRQVTSLADFVAEWLIGFGYRRLVSEDDTTVELMADAMSSKTSVPIAMQDEQTARFYRRMARAAVRALREGGVA